MNHNGRQGDSPGHGIAHTLPCRSVESSQAREVCDESGKGLDVEAGLPNWPEGAVADLVPEADEGEGDSRGFEGEEGGRYV